MSKKNKKTEEIPEVEGYEREMRTISMLRANGFALVLMVGLGALLGVPFFMIWGAGAVGGYGEMLVLLAVIVLGTVVHELIHGVTWMICTHSSFGHLSFGVLPGGVYCHIDKPMTKRYYVIGALMPLLLMGVVPMVAAFFIGSFLWFLSALTFIVAAAGDMMIVWAIRKESVDTLVYDHPSEAGCLVYHKVTSKNSTFKS